MEPSKRGLQIIAIVLLILGVGNPILIGVSLIIALMYQQKSTLISEFF